MNSRDRILGLKIRTHENPIKFLEGLILMVISHYWNRALCLVFKTLGKRQKTLGKPFAECHTRQSRDGKKMTAKQALPSVFFRALGKAFAKCPFDTRRHSANKSSPNGVRWFAECSIFNTRQRHFFKKIKFVSLPSVHCSALGKEPGLPSVLGWTLGKPCFQVLRMALCRV